MIDFSNIKWMEEKINSMPKNNGIYKFVCTLLCKSKLSYKEMYLLLFSLNKKNLSENNLKRDIMKELINIYNYNHKN